MINPAQDHPEYTAEQRVLQLTLGALEALLQSLSRKEPHGREAHAAKALYAHYGSRYQSLRSALPSPVFGRIDFAPEATGIPETYYLGRTGFNYDGQQVIDWQSAQASLFYLGSPGPSRIDSPEGPLSGTMLLKRSLGIQSGRLQTIVDEYDLRQTRAAGEPARIADPEDYLRQILAGKRQAGLHDIVASIQGRQYDLIRASSKQALLIQGAAGSGKTSIALHRLAYLLYPANSTGIEAERCLIVGPNRLFLHYTAAVLPDLGVDLIPQVTFAEWSVEQMGLEGYRLTDSVLETLLSPTIEHGEKARQYRRSMLRNSRRMGDLLEKYVERRRRAAWPPAGFTFQALGPLGVTISLTPAQIAEAYALYAALPLKRHRERFLETLRGWLVEDYDQRVSQRAKELVESSKESMARAAELSEAADRLESLAQATRTTLYADLDALKIAEALEEGMSGLRQLEDYHRKQVELARVRVERLRSEALGLEATPEAIEHRHNTLDELATQLAAEVDRCWPPLEVVPEHAQLLADPALLRELGESLFTADEVTQIHQAAPAESNVIDQCDLPALLYLYVVAGGLRVPLYDHVIIDEAQDVSRLQFEVVRRFSRNGSFTILGDLSQSIHAYRGIPTWDEVKEAFAGSQTNYHEIRRGYRTTYEIAMFTNDVLRSTTRDGKTIFLTEPFERHGDSPGMHPLANEQEVASAVAATVRQVQAAGYQHIAIIAKSAEECSRLADGLDGEGILEAAVALSPDYQYTGGLVLLPVHLAKGMEFEAALVVGADDTNYPATAYDGRLLHTALTRAQHVLHVFWVKSVSYHLEQALRAHLDATLTGVARPA